MGEGQHLIVNGRRLRMDGSTSRRGGRLSSRGDGMCSPAGTGASCGKFQHFEEQDNGTRRRDLVVRDRRDLTDERLAFLLPPKTPHDRFVRLNRERREADGRRRRYARLLDRSGRSSARAPRRDLTDEVMWLAPKLSQHEKLVKPFKQHGASALGGDKLDEFLGRLDKALGHQEPVQRMRRDEPVNERPQLEDASLRRIGNSQWCFDRETWTAVPLRGATLCELASLVYGDASRWTEFGLSADEAGNLQWEGENVTRIDISGGLMELAKSIVIHRLKRAGLAKSVAYVLKWADPGDPELEKAMQAAADYFGREGKGTDEWDLYIGRIGGANTLLAGGHYVLGRTALVRDALTKPQQLYRAGGWFLAIIGVGVEAYGLAEAWQRGDIPDMAAHCVGAGAGIYASASECPWAVLPVIAYGVAHEKYVKGHIEQGKREIAEGNRRYANDLLKGLPKQVERLRQDVLKVRNALKRWEKLYGRTATRAEDSRSTPESVLEKLELDIMRPRE